MNGADHGGPQHPLLTHHELLEEVDGDIVVGREEDAVVKSEKVVDLVLASALRLELLEKHESLCLLVCNLVHVLIVLLHQRVYCSDCKLIYCFKMIYF